MVPWFAIEECYAAEGFTDGLGRPARLSSTSIEMQNLRRLPKNGWSSLEGARLIAFCLLLRPLHLTSTRFRFSHPVYALIQAWHLHSALINVIQLFTLYTRNSGANSTTSGGLERNHQACNNDGGRAVRLT